MAYPNVVTVGGTQPTATLLIPVPSEATEPPEYVSMNAAVGFFEVDASGAITTNPLGQSGPFVVSIDSEDILCSHLSGGRLTVFDDGGESVGSGRGYNSTTIAAHADGATVTLIATSVQDQAAPTNNPVFTGSVTGPSFAATGLTGSVAASRYVGATATGHPTTGAHLLGDWVVTQDGNEWVCTTAGTPGTWTNVNGTKRTAAVF